MISHVYGFSRGLTVRMTLTRTCLPAVDPPPGRRGARLQAVYVSFSGIRVDICDTMDPMDTFEVTDLVDPFETTAMTLRIDRGLHKRIRIAAAHEEKSITEWVREALELVVNRVEAKRAE